MEFSPQWLLLMFLLFSKGLQSGFSSSLLICRMSGSLGDPCITYEVRSVFPVLKDLCQLRKLFAVVFAGK